MNCETQEFQLATARGYKYRIIPLRKLAMCLLTVIKRHLHEHLVLRKHVKVWDVHLRFGSSFEYPLVATIKRDFKIMTWGLVQLCFQNKITVIFLC